jgi:hypothetical protein
MGKYSRLDSLSEWNTAFMFTYGVSLDIIVIHGFAKQSSEFENKP